MARPQKQINAQIVEDLAAVSLSVAEIGAVVGCNRSTLQRRFAAALQKGSERCNASLKRRQFDLAMDGNPAMLIWLGKVRLGQKEPRLEYIHEHHGQIPVAVDILQQAIAAATPADPLSHSSTNGNGNGHAPDGLV